MVETNSTMLWSNGLTKLVAGEGSVPYGIKFCLSRAAFVT